MTDTISWTVYTDGSRAWTMTATHHESGRTWREAGTGARSVARAKIEAEIDAWMQAGRPELPSLTHWKVGEESLDFWTVRNVLACHGDGEWSEVPHAATCPKCRARYAEYFACPTDEATARLRARIVAGEHPDAIFAELNPKDPPRA